MSSSKSLTFLPREFKGSRLRCLLLTNRSDADVAKFFALLVTPSAVVTSKDLWAPHGFLHSDEAKLDEAFGLLTEGQRAEVTKWWLAKPGRGNRPNWDLVCQCAVGDRRGLILVEGKAHEGELADDRCGATNKANFHRIGKNLAEATAGWNTKLPGFNLTANSHYQLSNRFAFAWKLATMKIPVVLVYLGFLDAEEMSGRILRDHAQWRTCVVERSRGVIPEAAWGQTFYFDGTPLAVLIRSSRVRVEATVAAMERDA